MCLSLNYVQEFDPIKYILANISEAGGDATYFDKQVSGGQLTSPVFHIQVIITRVHDVQTLIYTMLLSDICVHTGADMLMSFL